MLSALVIVKTVILATSFVGLSMVVLFSGSHIISEEAHNAWAHSSFPKNSHSLIDKFLHKLERYYAFLATSTLLITIIEFYDPEILLHKEFRIIILLVFTCVCCALFSCFSNLVMRNLSRVFFLSTSVIIDLLLTASAFIADCVRVQWQLLIVALPWILIRKLWHFGEYVSSISPTLLILMILIYCFLIGVALSAFYERILRRKLFYDCGIALSIVAILGILVNDVDNEWTSIL